MVRRVTGLAMKSVKDHRAPMVDAGGVVVVDGGVGAAAMRSCRRVRGLLARDLMLR